MRPTSTLIQMAVCLSSFSSITAAWPGSGAGSHLVIARQNDGTDSLNTAGRSDTAPASESTGDSSNNSDSSDNSTDSGSSNNSDATDATDSSGNTTEPPSSSQTNGRDGADLNTAEAETGTGGTKTGTKSSQRTQFPAIDPPGGVSIVSPAVTALPTPLYKIGDFVTFSWNYTSLQGDPTAIDVIASCSFATQTVTLTSNMTFATSVNFVWDTNKQADDPENPLLTEMYTLIIKDSDTAITDLAEPGYLAVFNGLQFGLYTPQPYTPLADGWECTGCNSAISDLDQKALGFALTMSVVTVLSFTWFVTGLGLE